MVVTLSMAAPDLDDEDLQALTRELALTLNQETDLQADLVTRPAEPGDRSGGIELLCQLGLTFLGGGAAVALIEVLKAYLTRSKSIEVEFAREDGRKLKVRGDELTQDRMEQISAMAKKFFEGE